MLPAIDLPGVEPPSVNPKFQVKEFWESMKFRGPLSLSPDTLAQPPNWSKLALAGFALLGAGAGVAAYRHKHK
jgi:hypothetical protein